MKMVRNAQAIKDLLHTTPEGQVIAKGPLRIQFPARYKDLGLATIGIDNFTIGIVAIIAENIYSVLSVCAPVELKPSRISMTKVDNTEYYEFFFEEGDVVINTLNVLQTQKNIYTILDEFFFKGKVPWYIGYEDLGKIFDTAKKYAGSNVANTPETIEFMAAFIARPKKDRVQYLRTHLESYSDASVENIDYVAMTSIYYSIKSTLNKIAGNYFSQGVVSALVTPVDKVEKIESILRA